MKLKGLIQSASMTGYLLGSFVVFPLILWGINEYMVRYKGNYEADQYVDTYIENSIEIKVNRGKIHEKGFMRDHESYYPYLGAAGEYTVKYMAFYVEEYDKYMRLELINHPHYFNNGILLVEDDHHLVLTVNSEDLENPHLGSKEHPVPVFRVVGDEEPIQFPKNDGNDGIYYINQEIDEEHYRDNVYVYLRYFVPKETFEKRFIATP